MINSITNIKKKAVAQMQREPGVIFDGKFYSYDDIYEMAMANESFVGKKCDKAQLKKWFQLNDLAIKLAQMGEFNYKVDLPRKNERHAIISLETGNGFLLDEKGKEIFAEMLQKCDSFSFGGYGEPNKHSFTFDVLNLWED